MFINPSLTKNTAKSVACPVVGTFTAQNAPITPFKPAAIKRKRQTAHHVESRLAKTTLSYCTSKIVVRYE